MSKTYDVLVIGPVSLDHNIDYQGNERKEVGGAVVASGFAAAKSGNRTALFTKLNPADANVEDRFAGSGADVYWKPSQATCSIRNQYFTADKEKRVWCTAILTVPYSPKPPSTARWQWTSSVCCAMWSRTRPWPSTTGRRRRSTSPTSTILRPMPPRQRSSPA